MGDKLFEWLRYRAQRRIDRRLSRGEGNDIAGHRDSVSLLEIVRWHEDELHILAVSGQHGEVDVAGALRLPFAVQCRHPARSDQSA